MEIIAKIIFPTIIVVMATIVSIIVFIPQITNPAPLTVLLDETVVLTESSYEKEYYLQFAKGDRLSVKFYSYGQPIDYKIIDPNRTVVDEGEIINDIYERQLIVTMDGSYTFYVGADAGTPRVRITIVKQ